MKKLIYLANILFICVVLSACNNGRKSYSFDEAAVRTEAEVSIADFNERNYQSIMDRGNTLLKNQLTLEQWQEVCDPYLDRLGNFLGITATEYLIQTGNDGNEYAAVVAVASYDEGNLTFSIAFDEEMKLAQFLIQ